MNYLLTEEEFQALQKRAKARDDLGFTLEELQIFCSKVANELPIHRDWCPDEKSPWGCILTSRNEYCDACPARIICPHKYKNWSK